MIQNFAFGVDVSWVSQLEEKGFCWIDYEGNKVDPFRAARDMGADSVRLRVFVNPPADGMWWKALESNYCMLGHCDAAGVLEMAKRVKDQGMRLMIDFHYSDYFADPTLQDIPKEWEDDDYEKLTKRVYQHTKDVLMLLKENDIAPEWVQVGNEINPGVMLPNGSLTEHPKDLVGFLNAGYDAVKECFPECKVITHLAGGENRDLCIPFLDNFFKNQGKTDILGFSYYPYWSQSVSDKELLAGCLKEYNQRYHKPVMITEVGGEDHDEEGTYQLIRDTMDALAELKEQGLGVFYWEPEVNREMLPDHYPLGAARLLDEHTLQYTKALTAYKEQYKEQC